MRLTRRQAMAAGGAVIGGASIVTLLDATKSNNNSSISGMDSRDEVIDAYITDIINNNHQQNYITQSNNTIENKSDISSYTGAARIGPTKYRELRSEQDSDIEKRTVNSLADELDANEYHIYRIQFRTTNEKITEYIFVYESDGEWYIYNQDPLFA